MSEASGERADEQESNQGAYNNHDLESTLARMANYFERQEERQNGNGRNGERVIPTEVPDDVALERFQKFKPPRFSGEMDEETAERWIESMEDICETLNYSELRKVSFGRFQLEGPAKAWWRVVDKRWKAERTPRTWAIFLMEFRKKFIPEVTKEKREEEFMSLKQKSLTVAQYELQFTRLSKYAPEMVNTEVKHRRKFLQGLNVEIQDALVTVRVGTYAELVEMEQRLESSQAKVREFFAP